VLAKRETLPKRLFSLSPEDDRSDALAPLRAAPSSGRLGYGASAQLYRIKELPDTNDIQRRASPPTAANKENLMPQKLARVLRTGLPLLLLSCPAYSDEPYRFELRGGYSTIDSNLTSNSSSLLGSELGTGNESTRGLGFSGDYFFRRLEAASGPLQEAAFLERTPTLSFSIAEARTDSESSSSGLFGAFTSVADSEASEYGLRYRFVAPQKPWLGIVGYDEADSTTAQLGGKWGEERTGYSLGIGRYVGPRTAVTAEYGRARLEISPPANLLPGAPSSLRSESLTLGVHSVLPLGTQRHLGLTAALHETAFTTTSFDSSVGSYELGVTYYPRTDISIGLSAIGEYDTPADWGNRDRYEYLLEASWFVTRSMAVGLAYETTDSRISFVDSFGSGGEAENDSSGVRVNFSWRH
jgi:hypothetical protein